MYDKRVLSNHITGCRKCVCSACQAIGYSPKGIEKYPSGNNHYVGHLQLDSIQLNNWKMRGRRGALACLRCRANKEAEERQRQKGLDGKAKLSTRKNKPRCTCKWKTGHAIGCVAYGDYQFSDVMSAEDSAWLLERRKKK
jgi:hypothetical protein